MNDNNPYRLAFAGLIARQSTRPLFDIELARLITEFDPRSMEHIEYAWKRLNEPFLKSENTFYRQKSRVPGFHRFLTELLEYSETRLFEEFDEPNVLFNFLHVVGYEPYETFKVTNEMYTPNWKAELVMRAKKLMKYISNVHKDKLAVVTLNTWLRIVNGGQQMDPMELLPNWSHLSMEEKQTISNIIDQYKKEYILYDIKYSVISLLNSLIDISGQEHWERSGFAEYTGFK